MGRSSGARSRWIAGVIVGLAVVGCDPKDPPRPETPPEAPIRDLQDMVASAPVKRYIGVSATTPKAPEGWTITGLNSCEDKVEECFYLAEFDGPESITGEDVGDLNAAFFGGDRSPPAAFFLAPDLPVVATAGELTPALYDTFKERLAGGVGTVQPIANQPLVTLAIVDTYLTVGTTFLGASPGALDNTHGYTLLALTHQLLCGTTAPCPVRVESWGGLPYVPPGTTPGPNGTGDYGTFGSVGQAIEAQLARWASAPPPPTKLVINLSLGWHPQHGGAPGNRCEWPAPIRFLYRQIVAARQAGALVVVAAGNRTGGAGGDTGLLYPAGWKDMGMDDRATPEGCSALPGVGDKLLWSVGAVDATGRALPLGRVGDAGGVGGPDFAAYGDHAVTQLGNVEHREKPALTGTSVSAAIVSAAAAVAWTSELNKGPLEIADVVGTAAGSDPNWVHLCRGAPGTYYGCVQAAARAASWPEWDTGVGSGWTQKMAKNQGKQTCAGHMVDVFVEENGTATPTKTVSWCPEDELYSRLSATPWMVGPQPDEPPCPPCALRVGAGKLFLFVDDASVTGSGMSDVSLQLLMDDNTQRRFWIDPGLMGVAPWALEIPIAPSDTVVGARLVGAHSAQVPGTGTATNTLQTSVIMPLALFQGPTTP